MEFANGWWLMSNEMYSNSMLYFIHPMETASYNVICNSLFKNLVSRHPVYLSAPFWKNLPELGELATEIIHLVFDGRLFPFLIDKI